MKKLLFVVCSLQLLVFFAGCSKEKQTLLKNTWEVESMTLPMDSSNSEFIHFPAEFFSFDNYYIFTLEFLNKEAFRVRFRSGSVYGKVKIEKNHKISFFEADSKGFDDYSEWCFRALANTNYYEIDGERLVLRSAEEEFNFKRKEGL